MEGGDPTPSPCTAGGDYPEVLPFAVEVVGTLLCPKRHISVEESYRLLRLGRGPLRAVRGALWGKLRESSRHCEGQAGCNPSLPHHQRPPRPFCATSQSCLGRGGAEKEVRHERASETRDTRDVAMALYAPARGNARTSGGRPSMGGPLSRVFLLAPGLRVPRHWVPLPAIRGLRGRDLRLTREGKPCSHRDFEDADELTVFIRGSKTDVYNRGEYRNHYKTGLLLCPVRAAVQLFKAFPLRFAGGPEEEELLFRDAEGRPLPRTVVSTLIRKAAEALGGTRRSPTVRAVWL